MSDTSFATVGDLKELRAELITKQEALKTELNAKHDEYQKACEADRKELRGEVIDIKTSLKRLEEKTDKQTSLLTPMAAEITAVAKQLKGILRDPRIRLALSAAILAFLAYITYRLTPVPPQPQQVQAPLYYPPGIFGFPPTPNPYQTAPISIPVPLMTTNDGGVQ